jgi:hypothetical protein
MKEHEETFPSQIRPEERYNIQDTRTDDDKLLAFKGDDEGPIDKEKASNIKKPETLKGNQDMQNKLDLNPESFPAL